MSFDHPDPDGEQLLYLQQLFERIEAGNIHEVQQHYMQPAHFKDGTTVPIAEFQALVADGYLWLDYISMPQNTGSSVGGAAEAVAELLSPKPAAGSWFRVARASRSCG